MISRRINKLKAGMQLAEPVCDIHGVLLVNEGIILTDKHIKIFKAWGVTAVQVESEDKDTESSENKLLELKEESIEKELNEKFSLVLDDEIMVEIMRVAGKILKEQLV